MIRQTCSKARPAADGNFACQHQGLPGKWSLNANTNSVPSIWFPQTAVLHLQPAQACVASEIEGWTGGLVVRRQRRLVEKVTLEDVEKHGDVLLLEDGRRLKINNRDDATVASIWMPSTRLTLRKGKGRSASVTVTNEETGETISATAIAR
jgi:hypothetical protein